ncbi:DUF4116 domain-containing protein [Candidatus Synchoanobacter obligatus]|uniref:DUF4116 domain-containing protein n=1 Tax=Candidatus Synchoanobacter obligatus TaxID=2919597 RepID=A0ABT1L4C7_9GAMM|nr:DUF4116 domain-containing protein [Candidatus Synchoanobacter obligatus]MCP8351723.1 DUF4116 domain-containing protein [Candidatus Synchoanobacter obligatus]
MKPPKQEDSALKIKPVMPEMSLIDKLPEEIFLHILIKRVESNEFKWTDLIKLQLVSKRWQRFCRHNMLWRIICHQYADDQQIKTMIDDDISNVITSAERYYWHFIRSQQMIDDFVDHTLVTQDGLNVLDHLEDHQDDLDDANLVELLYAQNPLTIIQNLDFLEAQCLLEVLPNALKDINQDYRSSLTQVAVQSDVRAMAYATDEQRSSRELALPLVRIHPKVLMHLSEGLTAELTNNKNLMLTVVARDGNLLELASDTLKNDRDVVFAATQEDSAALLYASQALLSHKPNALALVAEVGSSIEYLPSALRRDDDVIDAAMQQDPGAIQYVLSESITEARALMAVQSNGFLYRYVGTEMQRNLSVIREAFSSYTLESIFPYSNELEMIKMALTKNIEAFNCLPEVLKGHIDFVKSLYVDFPQVENYLDHHTTICLAISLHTEALPPSSNLNGSDIVQPETNRPD